VNMSGSKGNWNQELQFGTLRSLRTPEICNYANGMFADLDWHNTMTIDHARGLRQWGRGLSLFKGWPSRWTFKRNPTIESEVGLKTSPKHPSMSSTTSVTDLLLKKNRTSQIRGRLKRLMSVGIYKHEIAHVVFIYSKIGLIICSKSVIRIF